MEHPGAKLWIIVQVHFSRVHDHRDLIQFMDKEGLLFQIQDDIRINGTKTERLSYVVVAQVLTASLRVDA